MLGGRRPAPSGHPAYEVASSAEHATPFAVAWERRAIEGA